MTDFRLKAGFYAYTVAVPFRIRTGIPYSPDKAHGLCQALKRLFDYKKHTAARVICQHGKRFEPQYIVDAELLSRLDKTRAE